MNKNSTLRSINENFKFLGIYSISAIVFCFLTFFNCVMVATEFDEGFLGMQIGLVIVLIFMPTLITSDYTTNYKLICMFPMKSSSVPLQMALSVDMIWALPVLFDITMLLMMGMYRFALCRGVTYILIYILAHLNLAFSVTPALEGIVVTRKGRPVLCIIFYSLSVSTSIVSQALCLVDFNKEVKLAVSMFAVVFAIGAVFTRIFAYRMLKSKIRALKVYKANKAKSEKELSYV